MKDTKQQFEHVIAICRDLFAKKLHDYGAAWRIMRPSSVTVSYTHLTLPTN